jgi:SAM-dependent methyltransferase
VLPAYRFWQTRKLALREDSKSKVNLGCPIRCEGYLCVDISPIEQGVVRDDALHYLSCAGSELFDEIFSKNMFEHLTNPGKFLELCFSSLKRGGRLVLITDNAEFLPFYFPFCSLNHTGLGAHSRKEYADSAEHGHTKHFAVFTKMHLENFLVEYGFREISIKRILFGSRLKALAVRP